MKRFLMLLCVVGCEKATPATVKPDASCPGVAPGADAAQVTVPDAAPCSTYQAMLDDGRLVMAQTGYRIIVARTPFLPLIGAVEDIGSGRVLVYGPELAGDRLGAVGRIDDADPSKCAWADYANL